MKYAPAPRPKMPTQASAAVSGALLGAATPRTAATTIAATNVT